MCVDSDRFQQPVEQSLSGDPQRDADAGRYRHRGNGKFSTLQMVATKINNDAVAAMQPNPNYQAYSSRGMISAASMLDSL